MNEVYFDIPYSSFKKDFLDTYSYELTENLFLHLLGISLCFAPLVL